ncbi:MAG: tRNA pseudouridine(65) synthase TruC [Phaeodactylibacter sp.]|nr:tRNA pseudouridine(65) synthase TruC [Phaeodactylibacter sp.]
MLSILYEDEDLIAINKPHGLLVHRSPIAREVRYAAVQQLRDQIGQRVYPVHRLDRKTGGVLLFSKNPANNGLLQSLFMEGRVKKTYQAIARGYVPESGLIDYALRYEDKMQEARTHFQCLQTFELPLPFNGQPTSRYSLVELQPTTGRFHQLRKHLAHIYHPIIGDRPHGCNKQNRLWKEHFKLPTMFLHGTTLQFELPDKRNIRIEAPFQEEFRAALHLLQAQSLDNSASF